MSILLFLLYVVHSVKITILTRPEFVFQTELLVLRDKVIVVFRCSSPTREGMATPSSESMRKACFVCWWYCSVFWHFLLLAASLTSLIRFRWPRRWSWWPVSPLSVPLQALRAGCGSVLRRAHVPFWKDYGEGTGDYDVSWGRVKTVDMHKTVYKNGTFLSILDTEVSLSTHISLCFQIIALNTYF